ncbi:hypothetical protein GGS20DRAFT_567155 [Poronia punctata]|nr:hypothetical protein GGS20DRAFT_567155 [Poronia punctata]
MRACLTVFCMICLLRVCLDDSNFILNVQPLKYVSLFFFILLKWFSFISRHFGQSKRIRMEVATAWACVLIETA